MSRPRGKIVTDEQTKARWKANAARRYEQQQAEKGRPVRHRLHSETLRSQVRVEPGAPLVPVRTLVPGEIGQTESGRLLEFVRGSVGFTYVRHRRASDETDIASTEDGPLYVAPETMVRRCQVVAP